MTELSIISGKSGRAASRSLSTNKRSMQVMLNYSGALGLKFRRSVKLMVT